MTETPFGIPRATARFLGSLLSIPVAVALYGPGLAGDGINVTMHKGPGAFEVTLDWTGGSPPFGVYRSTSPSGVVDPGNLEGTSTDPTWIDAPPDVPILFYVVSPPPGAVCGNGAREGGEQCDDGNLVNLDGCDGGCRFEQLQRATWFKMQFLTDAVCTHNQLGGAFTAIAQSTLQNSIDSSVLNGSLSLLLAAGGISDLTGTNEPAFSLGVISGSPETRGGTLPYNGSNDLDWWHVLDPATLDAGRHPLSTLPASITANALTAGPGTVSLRLLPGGGLMRMASTKLTITTGATSVPLVSAAGDPPGHLPAEHLDPVLVSYGTCGTQTLNGSGRLCGDVTARSLALTPIDTAFVSSCTEGYTVTNSMLDLIVGGCHAFTLLVVRATQPDQADPTVPPAGAGAPYRFTANAQHVVNVCKDRNLVTVDLDMCLDAAAYSSFFRLATNRVIPR